MEIWVKMHKQHKEKSETVTWRSLPLIYAHPNPLDKEG